MQSPDPADLRQAVLMAAVLDDVDVRPADRGVVLPGSPDLMATWHDVARATGGHPPTSAAGRRSLTRWLRLARAIGDLPPGELRTVLRPLALPPEHVLHPGPAWVRQRIEGDLLDLGIGLLGLLDDPDEVVPAPDGLLEAIGADPDRLWTTTSPLLEELGAVAAVRAARAPDQPLRPMGDCDVLTLLGSVVLRTALAAKDGVGMRGLAAPMRTRGWTDPDHIDSVFVRAAAMATDDDERGLSIPVLVTSDGVFATIDGCTPSDFVIRESREPRRIDLWDAARARVRYRST
jgi:hypothetical protein